MFHNIRDSKGRFAPKQNKKIISTSSSKKKKQTVRNCYVGLVLDESGSMESVREATQSGYNEYINSLIKDNDNLNTKVTLVRFRDTNDIKVPYSNAILGEELKMNDYIPWGQTPLYQSIKKAIDLIEKSAKPEDAVILTIFTDGANNAGNVSKEQINTIITDKRDRCKWMINYIGMGTKQSVINSANNIGIFTSNTLNYTSNTADNIGMTMNTLTNANTKYRSAFSKTGVVKEEGFFSEE